MTELLIELHNILGPLKTIIQLIMAILIIPIFIVIMN